MRKRGIIALAGPAIALGAIAVVAFAGDAGTEADCEIAALDAEAKKNYYVGVSACKECHRKNHVTWLREEKTHNGSHRRGFQVLKIPARKNPKCLKCHSTGYGHETGFKSLEETPHLANVGCESCHGPGGLHVELAKKKPDPATVKDWLVPAPDKESCIYCHKYHRHF